MKQNTIKPARGSVRERKRVGRGESRGNFSGRGMKGQNSRTGGGVRPGFEGGQTPLLRRMPKLRGFKNPSRVPYIAINLKDLNRFEEGETVNLETLVKKGMVRVKKSDEAPKVKLLSFGELSKKLKIEVHAASKEALEKAKKSGSEVILPSS